MESLKNKGEKITAAIDAVALKYSIIFFTIHLFLKVKLGTKLVSVFSRWNRHEALRHKV